MSEVEARHGFRFKIFKRFKNYQKAARRCEQSKHKGYRWTFLSKKKKLICRVCFYCKVILRFDIKQL